jgi:hypothetical protein
MVNSAQFSTLWKEMGAPIPPRKPTLDYISSSLSSLEEVERKLRVSQTYP